MLQSIMKAPFHTNMFKFLIFAKKSYHIVIMMGKNKAIIDLILSERINFLIFTEIVNTKIYLFVRAYE